MAFNWQLTLRIVSALAGAIAALPADFDCRAIAKVIQELLAVATGVPPPEAN